MKAAVATVGKRGSFWTLDWDFFSGAGLMAETPSSPDLGARGPS
jgi:hypothetical protein